METISSYFSPILFRFWPDLRIATGHFGLEKTKFAPIFHARIFFTKHNTTTHV